jgi:hypothetical protein
MRLTLTGVKELERVLDLSSKTATARLAGPMRLEGELIMTKAKRGTPVAPDGGTLRASGHVQEPKITRRNVSVTLGFGGAAADYALAVHEHPSRHSPPSWKGKTIHWNAAGTGPHFLSRPMKEAQKGLARRLAKSLDLF